MEDLNTFVQNHENIFLISLGLTYALLLVMGTKRFWDFKPEDMERKLLGSTQSNDLPL